MPKNLVRTPYLQRDLDAPEMTENSNIADVLVFLGNAIANEVEWVPRSYRKGVKPKDDAACFDIKFRTAADATRFAFEWTGKMRSGQRTL